MVLTIHEPGFGVRDTSYGLLWRTDLCGYVYASDIRFHSGSSCLDDRGGMESEGLETRHNM